MVLKLNHTFLDTLRQIKEQVKRPVEFHFWPNMITTVLSQTAKEIRETLPGAFTYERSQYNHYIRQVQQCHIQLGTFPFGGTNSNIDAMLLGIPFVCMEGDEPHATCDAKMARRAGMPEWLVAQNQEEYIAAAVRLAQQAGVPISADPVSRSLARRLAPHLEDLFLITPNAGEAEVLLGHALPSDDPAARSAGTNFSPIRYSVWRRIS